MLSVWRPRFSHPRVYLFLLSFSKWSCYVSGCFFLEVFEKIFPLHQFFKFFAWISKGVLLSLLETVLLGFSSLWILVDLLSLTSFGGEFFLDYVVIVYGSFWGKKKILLVVRAIEVAPYPFPDHTVKAKIWEFPQWFWDIIRGFIHPWPFRVDVV